MLTGVGGKSGGTKLVGKHFQKSVGIKCRLQIADGRLGLKCRLSTKCRLQTGFKVQTEA